MVFDILIGIAFGKLFSSPNSEILFIILGIIFALLPDIDFLIYIFLKSKNILPKSLLDHREIFHYPLPYLIFGSLLVYLINPNFIYLFVINSSWHFLHDSIGEGWGIPWLLPLNDNRYKLFYQYDLRQANHPQKLIWIWTKEEQEELINKFGDPQWYRHKLEIFTDMTFYNTFLFIVSSLFLIYVFK